MPKYHGVKLVDVPDEDLRDILVQCFSFLFSFLPSFFLGVGK